MAGGRRSSLALAVLAILAVTSLRAAMAGLIIENDGSDLCVQNLKDCTSRCAPPQSFLFMCNSGGTFNKPYSDCKCTTPPPVGAVTDGSAIFQMVQWPGPEACQANTWLYDCAQYLNLQSVSNNMQGQATDQASAMAAIAAMAAAQQAQQAAMAAAQQAQAQAAAGGSGQGTASAAQPGATVGSPAGVPGMDPSSNGVPGLVGSTPDASASMGPSSGSQSAPMMGGQSAMGPAVQMGAAPAGGAGMMGASMGAGGGMPPSSSLMGNSMMGHRHLLQGMMGAGAGIPTAAGPAALPSTSLGPACMKPIQGLVTAQGGAVMVIPNFKGVATMATRGNDTMFIQLGGQGSSCVAGYKLKAGQIMDLGRPANAPAPAAATAKSAAGLAAASSAAASLVVVLATLLLLL